MTKMVCQTNFLLLYLYYYKILCMVMYGYMYVCMLQIDSKTTGSVGMNGLATYSHTFQNGP